MVEKIRVSLWDIFSFFLTGLLVTLVLAAFFIAYGPLTFKNAFDTLSTFPATITLFAAPLTFTLLGMAVEPFANYLDHYFLSYVLGWVSKPKQKHTKEESLLKEEIRTKYMGSLNSKIEDPYAICKEYVETKQLSTTFMVFLSRYGFYRNCAFVAVASGVGVFFLAKTWFLGVAGFFICLAVAAVFKRRAADFYSYLAPTVYRAFLIDKVSWAPRHGA